MALDTYAALQTSILSWLARPGDPLVSPAVPDMIQLFEREATRRLKVGGAEKRASLTALSAAVALPADFGELRLATSGGVILTYVTPMQLPDGGGSPAHYTIIGNEMRLGPSPSGGCTIEIVYQSGVPPLSDTNISNWLLAQHPDCYLFGSLVEAESFIGSDDRIPLWAQRREAAFSSIESADRKARWGGAPLSIRAEGVSGGNGTAAGDWTSAPPVPIPITGIVAGDGLSGGGSEGSVTVALSTPVTVGRGGTGAATAAAALANLGGAPLASPILTGDPQAPTPAPGDADTSIATTAFVGAALNAQALAGDVTGPTNNTAVVRLQGRPVAATAPTSLQVLQWSGTNWVPATIAAGGTLTGVTAGTGITVSGAAPSPTVALTVPVTVANGGTGATTAGAALTALGAAPLNAPVFIGDARAVTPATADNDTSIATTAYVQAQGYATSAAMTTADNLRVLKAGDTMSGDLFISAHSLAVGSAMPSPAPLAGSSIGGVLSTGQLFGINAYFDGAAWRYLSGTTRCAFSINGDPALGIFSMSFASAGNAGAVATMSQRLAIDSVGNLTAWGGIGVNANSANPAVAAFAGQFNGFYAPDGSGSNGAIIMGVAANPTHKYTNTNHVFRDRADANGFATFDAASTKNTSGAWATFSDAKVKEDIAPYTRGLDAVLALNPVQFRYRAGTPFAPMDEPSRVLFGLIAQEVVPHVPEIVGKSMAEIKGVETEIETLEPGNLIYALINAVKELAAEVAALKGAPPPQRRRQ